MSQFLFSPFIKSLTCLRCQTAYGPGHFDAEQFQYVCNCRPNQLSDIGTLDVQYSYDAIQQSITPAQIQRDPDRSIGRYWPLLPISARASCRRSPWAIHRCWRFRAWVNHWGLRRSL
ncbi:MAG: hypothetical protein R2911_32430 [Caldilineaceae bacterium]